MTEFDEAFERLLSESRPKLHRYCARLTGSVVDGEDVLQEALVKAVAAAPAAGSIANPEGWLFRIAHNVALDFLRRRARRDALASGADVDRLVDPADVADDRLAAAAGLRTFMELPVAQRSSVILMDVLGYTVAEVAAIIESSVPAVKSALHRGRTRLRELAAAPEDRPSPRLDPTEQARLAAYVDRFNARDFDALRALLAEDVRLELVNRLRLNGRSQVTPYFHRYGDVHDWHFAPGLIDGRPAILVGDPNDPGARPKYFVLVEFRGDAVTGIRDFLFARYAIESAEIVYQ
jgi:RNA polymerase sigma-70 factor (ECF subfamily)